MHRMHAESLHTLNRWMLGVLGSHEVIDVSVLYPVLASLRPWQSTAKYAATWRQISHELTLMSHVATGAKKPCSVTD